MPRNKVQPHGWVALKLPNETVRVLQITPNSTISLGKYGSFPSNLIIDRPFHLTYEVQEKREGENFSRLRIVPGTELNADALVDTTAEEEGNDDGDVIAPAEGEELALVDESGNVVARSSREVLDESARQTLTSAEIDELKKKGTSAGKELIAKLLLSHTALDQKTAYSLAKYKLLKEKKHIRRFTVLPLDITMMAKWMLEDKDPGKIMEMRQEALALVGCWADVHFGGEPIEGMTMPHGGRWLVVDDAGGLLVGAMAERMGLLHPAEDDDSQPAEPEVQGDVSTEATKDEGDKAPATQPPSRKRPRRDDLEDHYAMTNTLTVIHANSQPNLSLLRYFGYDSSDPNPSYPYHPLFTHLMLVTWLQILSPEDDPTYAERPPEATAEEMAAWKTNRRGNYHRKRRRWARTRQIVDNTRAGGFSGLAVASTMDPISIVRHALPLLAGGSPIAIYSPTIEPLEQLADCFSIGRRGAWVATPPAEAEGKSLAELETWQGNSDFPINPTLLVGATVQTSRAKRWQVLPGRTHPVMMGKGGADGYVFTGWRAIPAEGRISARGKFQKKRGEGM